MLIHFQHGSQVTQCPLPHDPLIGRADVRLDGQPTTTAHVHKQINVTCQFTIKMVCRFAFSVVN